MAPTLPSFSSSKSRLALCLTLALGILTLSATAQTNPTPNTFSTVAGGYTGTYAAGAVCGGAASGSKYIALDTMGNGCPGPQATFSVGLSGIGVDGAGNIFVNDYTNSQVRRIDARSGIVTKVIGAGNTLCSTTTSPTGTKQDSIGSGCVNTSTTGPGSARGMNVDAWGNVILGSYNSNQINVVCLATSPLCPGTAGRKQVGSFYRIAGCVGSQGGATTAASGTTAYTGGDNSLASPYQNLVGDVAAWGLTGAAATAATVGTAGTCGSNTGGVNSARNAQADKYGNVYIADTNGDRYRVVLGPAVYNSVTNPLFAIINQNPKYTANEGFIYTILGGFSAFSMNSITYNIPTAAGGACTSLGATPAATDGLGDGCSFFETGKPSGGTTPAGLGVDRDGNPIFSDTQDNVVRVMYVGGSAMANIISLNNGGITPVPGTVYAIEGTGTLSKGTTPVLNVSAGSISSGNTKVAVDGSGNIYLSDGTGVNIIDSVTGYFRRPISSGGTACATGVNGNGDGCPTGQGTSYGPLASVGVAITVDNLGNLYIADSTGRVRKVLAGTLYPTAVGSTFTQNIVLHEPAGTTGITATLLNAASGISIPSAAPVCTLYTTNSDNTADCTVVVTFAPTVPGKVGATLSVTNVGGGGATTLYPLVGQATGAALVTDVASPITKLVTNALVAPTGLAGDTGGNFYTIDASPSGGLYVNGNLISSTYPSGVNQIALDTTGNVYATAVGASSITKYTLAANGTYTSGTFTIPGIALPQGIAIDAQNNLYVSDATTTSVYQVPNDAGYANQQAPTAVATGLANPNVLALDGLGNLIIAGTGTVYRVNASTGALATIASASSSAGGAFIGGLAPAGVAADAGGNVYVQDAGNHAVLEVPYQTFPGGFLTVISGQTTPSGIAVDGSGQVLVADKGSSPATIIKVQRASTTYTFPTNTTTFTGLFTNTGNANATGYSQTDSAEFPYTSSGPSGCGTISGTSPLLTGAACVFTVTPNLGGNGQLVTNTTTLTPSNSSGFLSLTAQEPTGTTYATTTTVTGPTNAVYKSSGTEITFTVNESSANSNSQNGELVNVTIDSGAPTGYTLTAGAATINVSGLQVGPHTISAVYPGDGTYLTSNGSANFSVTLAATTVSWTPSTLTQPYSAAIGTGVLNATATATASGLTAPGSFVYTAVPKSPTGPPVLVHSASYLPVGTYSLVASFFPTDSVDYAPSSNNVATYTVTKATTTAPVAASQFLVAADGTGNYTTVQAAVNALPSGGSIYIKPGTYTGNIAVVQPNIALRGLGGDPTKVILTHSGGAFNNGQVQNQFAGEFNQSQSNGSQLPAGSTVFTGDEASATLIVAKGINTAVNSSTLIPNNFYAENFSLINTYNTDTTTTTNVYTGGGATPCVVNSGAPRTYSDLFNNGLECASQALTIWTTSDLAVMNNIYTASLQDTVYAASQGNSIPARQYWFRGKITGNVDYIFGDAAAVFDNTSIYTAWHGTTATGTETIHAQNKSAQTGAVGDYLSGYIMNSDVFTSQSTGMTALYFGRPYGTYSTWIMLNSYVDQVNPTGYTIGLGPTLPPTTFGEFNDIPYTDPATNGLDLNGVPYLGTGGNTGTGVTGPRESSSTNPGTAMAGNSPSVPMTVAQAQAYFPTNFLSQTVASSTTPNWNPTAAIATNVNAFVPSGSSATVAGGSSVTLLMRPQTPGLGAVSNGVYTIPTGTYTLTDSFNGGTSFTIASGTLDAAGEAYFTSSNLAGGVHNLSWTYSGDANFSGSTTSSAYVLTVTGSSIPTSITLSSPGGMYGQSLPVNVSISSSSGSPDSGTITITIDGAATQTAAVSNGTALFHIPNLLAGSHSISGVYTGSTSYAPSATTSNLPVSVAKASFNIVTQCNDRNFGTFNACSILVPGPYQNADSPSTVFTVFPDVSTAATRFSPAGTYAYSTTYTATAFGSANYTFNAPSGTFNIIGNTHLPQLIIFPPLPNFAVDDFSDGPYQLSARASSGLPVTYTITQGSGIASLNGSILSVTGTGTVTILATQNDPTGDYATATLSRSFTAQ